MIKCKCGSQDTGRGKKKALKIVEYEGPGVSITHTRESCFRIRRDNLPNHPYKSSKPHFRRYDYSTPQQSFEALA